MGFQMVWNGEILKIVSNGGAKAIFRRCVNWGTKRRCTSCPSSQASAPRSWRARWMSHSCQTRPWLGSWTGCAPVFPQGSVWVNCAHLCFEKARDTRPIHITHTQNSVRNPVRSRRFTPYVLYGKKLFWSALKSPSLNKSLPAWKTHVKIMV